MHYGRLKNVKELIQMIEDVPEISPKASFNPVSTVICGG
jgi:hypothetical protein